MDNLKRIIYGARVLAAGLMALSSTSTTAGVRFPEFRPGGDECASPVLVLGADGRGSTGRFGVSRRMNANVFGQLDAAERKFVDHAATATIALADETLTVVFDCPVPPGMTASRVNEPWNGDRVEFNVHPQIGGKGECCFAANCGGPYAAHGYVNGSRDLGWSSRSKIVVENRPEGFTVTMTIPVRDAFGRLPEPGDAFGVNFVRKGPTCGGHSAWALDGGAFNTSSERYGTLVFGGGGAYFRRRLAETAARGRELTAADVEAEPLVSRACETVARAVAAHGDEAGSFAALERMFAELDRALVAIALRRTPVVVYDNVDVWSDDIFPTTESKTIREIALKAPRNTRRVKAFAVANLTDGDYLGNLKVLDVPDRLYWRSHPHRAPIAGIQERFTLRRSVWMHRKNGSPCADPLVELPFGSLLELGPGRAHACYLELDTKDMKPGEYRTTLALVTATVGVPSVRIPVRVVVTDDDLAPVDVIHLGFTHLHETFRNGHAPATNCVKTLVSRGYNTVVLSRFDGLYPFQDTNGVWRTPDYSDIDRYIDAWVAGGLPRERMYVMPFIAPERDRSASAWLWKGLRGRDGVRVPFGTTEYDVGARRLVTDFMAHMKERHGLRKDQVIWYPVDEGGGKLDDPTFASPISRGIHYARLIKGLDRGYRTFFDPLVGLCNTKEFQDRAAEFAEWFDYIELYRPTISSEAIRAVQRAPYRGKWTYHISSYESTALAYRKGAWMNLRDGFEPEATYWHLDESSSFAGHEHGYGSCYVDRDRDLLALSRRQLANDMSFEEGRLVKYLRGKYAGDAARLAALESIVKAAADHPSMKGFDVALEKLLDL